MPLLGNQYVLGNFPVDYFAGNGSATSFTLSQAPGSANALSIYISGVKQQSNSYSVSGNTLTFTQAPPAPPSGVTNNIEVTYKGLQNTINSPAAGTVSKQALATDVTPIVAKAWIHISSGNVIKGSNNVSSITLAATGQTLITFANPMPDANYAATCSFNGMSVSNNLCVEVGNYGAYSTTSVGIRCHDSAGSMANYPDVCVIVFSN